MGSTTRKVIPALYRPPLRPSASASPGVFVFPSTHPFFVRTNRSDAIMASMKDLPRITADPAVMGGKPCIRGMRVTVGTLVGLVASGHSPADILKAYPYLEPDDIAQALAYAAWRSEEVEVAITNS